MAIPGATIAPILAQALAKFKAVDLLQYILTEDCYTSIKSVIRE